MYTSWYTCCRVITVTSTTKTRKSSFFLCVPNGNVDIIYSGAKNTQRPDNITMHATITCIDSFSHSVDCFHSVSHRRVSFHNLGHSSGSLYSLGSREKIQAYVVHFLCDVENTALVPWIRCSPKGAYLLRGTSAVYIITQKNTVCVYLISCISVGNSQPASLQSVWEWSCPAESGSLHRAWNCVSQLTWTSWKLRCCSRVHYSM